MQGKGQLYDGDRFICDVSYDLDARHSRETGEWDVTGSLSGLNPRAVNRIDRHRTTYVLHLSDETQQNITIKNRDGMRGLCQFTLRPPIILEFE